MEQLVHVRRTACLVCFRCSFFFCEGGAEVRCRFMQIMIDRIFAQTWQDRIAHRSSAPLRERQREVESHDQSPRRHRIVELTAEYISCPPRLRLELNAVDRITPGTRTRLLDDRKKQETLPIAN